MLHTWYIHFKCDILQIPNRFFIRWWSKFGACSNLLSDELIELAKRIYPDYHNIVDFFNMKFMIKQGILWIFK
jgi:hypothetical protein